MNELWHAYNIVGCTVVSVSKKMNMVSTVRNQVLQLRSEPFFEQILIECIKEGEKYDLDELPLPRIRKVPRKLDDRHPAHQPASVDDHYRHKFFQMIDSCLSNLEEYFSAKDIVEVQNLFNLFKDSAGIDEMKCKYPQHDDSLKLQLVFCRSQCKAMQPGVRNMFPSVEKLLRLCL